ncbi:MAG: polysaccharide deacetylase family protein [Acidobacteriaceae bacterium]
MRTTNHLRSAPPVTPPQPSLRTHARNAAIHALSTTGALAFSRSRIAASGDIIVLTLHRIVPDADRGLCRSPQGMVLRESLFERLIDYLAAKTCMIAPREANLVLPKANLAPQVESIASSDRSRPRVLLTFDDGWLDNATVALPHLSRVGTRACFFVATSLVGQPTPFWPERMLGLLKEARVNGELASINRQLDQLQSPATGQHPVAAGPGADEALLSWLKQFPAATISHWMQSSSNALRQQAGWRIGSASANSLNTVDPTNQKDTEDTMERLMAWDQLRDLVHAGHTVGSHTCTHAILPQLRREDLMRELEDSCRALRQFLPRQESSALWVSYPNGSASHAVSRAAQEAGYSCGFINTPGLWRANSDPLLLPRVNLWDGTLVDERGEFSEKHLEYALFWRTRRAPAHA